MASYTQVPSTSTASSATGRPRGERSGCFIFPFFAGILVCLAVLVLFFLFTSGNNSPRVPSTTSANDTVVAQVSPTLIAQVLEKTIQTSGVPGTVKNIQVAFPQDGYMTITGDDTLTLLGFAVTKGFTITLQPYTNNCQVQMHVIGADFSGISVTGFVSNFESQINEHLHINSENLPQGFTYCITGVRTNSQGLFVTASVQSV